MERNKSEVKRERKTTVDRKKTEEWHNSEKQRGG
jgi:hypothetical protein